MYLRPSLIKGGGVLKKSQKTNSVILFYREKNNHRRKKISPAVTMYKRPMGQRHGPRHGLLARPMGGTAGSVLVSARHAGPCGSWAAGLAHGTAGTAPRRLLSSHPHRQTASPSPPPVSSPPRLISSPSTAGALPLVPRPPAELARVHHGPWAARAARHRVNGPCAVSWAEALAHSTVWHGTVGTAPRRGTASCRAACRHATYTC
jgi:hypothetical protein